MTDSYIIRDAENEEADFLSELALRSKSVWGYSDEFINECRPHIKVDSDYIREWPVVVLEKQNKIMGFYSLKKIKDENRLDNLWIEPEHLKSGFGKILFNDATKKAKTLGWKSFRLAGEPNSVPFYEKMGAVVIGQVQSRLKKDMFLPHMEKEI